MKTSAPLCAALIELAMECVSEKASAASGNVLKQRRLMMTRRIEMRGLLLAASAAFALGATVAQAADIGDVLKFRAPIVGCTDFSDAREALRLRTLHGAYAAESFALSIGVEREGRQCTVFGKPWRGKPDESEWKIVQKQKTQYTGPSEAWFCVETMTPFDVRARRRPKKRRRRRCLAFGSSCPKP